MPIKMLAVAAMVAGAASARPFVAAQHTSFVVWASWASYPPSGKRP